MIVAKNYGSDEASKMITTVAALQKLLDVKTVNEKEQKGRSKSQLPILNKHCVELQWLIYSITENRG